MLQSSPPSCSSQSRSVCAPEPIMTYFASVLTWLLPLLILRGSCDQRQDCEWGPYGEWSECDSCTKLQSRSRSFAVYAHFGGSACSGNHVETQECETTQVCPLQGGCGNRFRCPSKGTCIGQNLVCNGDGDCNGNGDETVCSPTRKYMICRTDKMLPHIEYFGLGFDTLKGERSAAGVFNIKSFGGQCRSVFSPMHRGVFRLPLSIKQFRPLREPEKDFSFKVYASKWHFAKEMVRNSSFILSSYQNFPFDQIPLLSAGHKLMVVQKDISLLKISTASPEYLILEEELWRALSRLPASYNYPAYRRLVEYFGTHYVSEGSLGGSYKGIFVIDQEKEKLSQQHFECDSVAVTPDTLGQQPQVPNFRIKRTEVLGGDMQWLAPLSRADPLQSNLCDLFMKWEASIVNSPELVQKKLRPLWELVKEVPCAGLKRLHLRRATEQYVSEHDVCHCPPCRNNGLAVMVKQVCRCICKPGTSGRACENGADIEGVTDGRWSCWSAWTCTGGQRSRQRTCTNPAPQNGGQECVGESTETSDCEENAMEYLKTVEPECFDPSVPPVAKCGPPPALINGYVLEPKDAYVVGSKVKYECTAGLDYHGAELECTTNQTWSHEAGLCSVGRVFGPRQ
ncbi:complement component C7 [Synchiropus splendidus]|uniref:complement component C7 n=1 Tax=Synchiropus splendidus TaxID=270530 RepID=UPI00237D574C|nr:complement component C7 [Synchiropus splendidus]